MRKSGLIAGISFLAGALFFALSFGFLQKSGDNQPRISPMISQAETQASASSQPAGGPNFVSIVKKVRPAVLQVLSEMIVERGGSIFGDDFFDQFFNTPRRRERRSGEGSGFFISADGYILTNNHVVQDAVKVRVITIDRNEYTAKIVGTDPKTDLALLKINAKDVPFIVLGDSNSVEVGEWVLAIGNPFGQELTVTSGIISAKGRQLGMAQYEDFLQTDAAINQGNSGGPLINTRGEAIGINSVILSPSSGNIGIGFAIPTNMAKKVVGDLRTKGKVVRGWFGISIRDISESEAKDYDLPTSGVLVFKVDENSPAQRAGLRRFDVITAINGKKVDRASDLQVEIANSNPGDVMEVTVWRNKEKLTLKVKVDEAPDSLRLQSSSGESNLDLGMILVKNSSQLARQYNLKTSAGLLVKNVDRGGVAFENGVQPGDVILTVNRTDVNSVEQFQQLLAAKEPGAAVLLFINRDGEEIPLRFKLPE